MMDKL